MRQIRVLVACEFSGRVRDAFLDRGFDAYSCDIAPSDSDRGKSRHYQCDVMDIIGVDTGAFVCYIYYMNTKKVEGFDAYRISDDGTLESNWRICAHYPGMPCNDRWRVLKLKAKPEGYLPVNLRGINKSRRTHVHRLVAEAFLGPPPYPKACVRHLDGNPMNNAVNNLAWGTYTDNEMDKKKHGTWDKRVTRAKLTTQTMRLIKSLKKSGRSHEEIAKKIGVSRSTVGRFLSGKTWQ